MSLAIGFVAGRRWWPRRSHFLAGGITFTPRFVVRLEPVNVVLYAGDDALDAKAYYHTPIPATADVVLFYDAGQLRGRRARVHDVPTTRTA